MKESIKRFIFTLSICFSFFIEAKENKMFLFDYGYKIPASQWLQKNHVFLEPQMLSAPQNKTFTDLLYSSNSLNSLKEDECYVNSLILGLDKRAGALMRLSKSIRQEDNVLGSRADAINILQINRCERSAPKIFAVYRGNSTPKSCIPDNWQALEGEKQRNIILADFYNLAGRREFLKCIKTIFSNKASFAQSLNLPSEQKQSFGKIHYLFEIKKNLNYQLFDRDEVLFPDFVSLMFDLDHLIQNDPQLESHFSKNLAARELDFSTLIEIGWNQLSEKLWNRKNMAGSGYERSLRIASTVYRGMAYGKFIFEDNPELLAKFFPVMRNNLSFSKSIENWMDSHGGLSFLKNLNFNAPQDLPSIIVWGPGKDSYIFSDGKEIGFYNMEKWEKRFKNIPHFLPIPSQMNKQL